MDHYVDEEGERAKRAPPRQETKQAPTRLSLCMNDNAPASPNILATSPTPALSLTQGMVRKRAAAAALVKP